MPEKRARKFERRLLLRIQNPLACFMLTNYGELFRRAQKIEKTPGECTERKVTKGKMMPEAESSQESTRSAQRDIFSKMGGSSGAP